PAQVVGVLLRDDDVVGELLLQAFDDQVGRLAIRDGDRLVAFLLLHGQLAAVVLHHQDAGLDRQPLRHLDLAAELVRAQWRSHGRTSASPCDRTTLPSGFATRTIQRPLSSRQPLVTRVSPGNTTPEKRAANEASLPGSPSHAWRTMAR